jgi:anti-anti-sigma regulatory factor
MSVTVKESSFVIDEEHLAAQVNDIREKLPNEGPEVLLDFFLAQTLDPEGIRALEELAAAAEAASTRIVLRGVNVEMYKVLKLAGLSDGFSFID